jgi:hypothetical protein
MYHLLYQSVIVRSAFMGFVWVSMWTAIISLNRVNKLIFVMVKCGVFFEVWTQFLNIIYRSFGFKWLIDRQLNDYSHDIPVV